MIDRSRDREQDLDRQQPVDREQAILADVRKFRLVEPRHISPELRPELDRMLRQKRLYKHVVLDYKGLGRKLEVLTTPAKDGSMPRLQKPREIYHDAAIYPAYQKAAAEIERKGGRIETVLNDFELKSRKARANNAAAPGRWTGWRTYLRRPPGRAFMTNEERLARLKQLRYTDREARFLLLAALHSGTFVQRQYAAFARIESGALTDQFIRKATTRQHIKPFPTRNRTRVYQVCKPIFVAIGQPDNRNRRMKQVDLTRLRLMALDFVLQNLQYTYLATETEKIEYFTARAGSTVSFPSRTYTSNITTAQTVRYFIEKYPVYDRSPGTSLTFLDEDSLTSFESFLDRYMALLCSIPHPEVVFVTTNPAIIPAAESVFTLKTKGQSTHIDFTTFELNFRERAALESKPLSDLATDDLLKLRALQRARCACYFETWKAGGFAALERHLNSTAPLPAPTQAQFSPYVLPTGYEFL